jgi:hypothetical protein
MNLDRPCSNNPGGLDSSSRRKRSTPIAWSLDSQVLFLYLARVGVPFVPVPSKIGQQQRSGMIAFLRVSIRKNVLDRFDLDPIFLNSSLLIYLAAIHCLGNGVGVALDDSYSRLPAGDDGSAAPRTEPQQLQLQQQIKAQSIFWSLLSATLDLSSMRSEKMRGAECATACRSGWKPMMMNEESEVVIPVQQ